MTSIIGLCTLKLHLHGFRSLKEKRSIIKSILTKTKNKFNVAVAETDYLDTWQSSEISIVTISSSEKHVHQMLNNIIKWIESNYPEAAIMEQNIDIF